MEKKRSTWSSKTGFLLSAIGSAVGLGNIWRYPYVAYSNGGGAFLIPYFVALLTAGIPLLMLEFSLGHKFRGSAPLSMTRASRGFEWIGWVPSMISGLITFYYSVIIAWSINYIFVAGGALWGSDTQDYFFNSFLQITDGPFELGGIRWNILIALAVVWFVVWLACNKEIKGIEATNKILIPLLAIMIVVIIIRGVTLPGAVLGLNQLLTPQWDKLTDPTIWLAAYGQVFFSLSVAMAIMITYSSYLPKDSDIANSAFITGFSNSAFEFFTALGVFSILGFMAQSQGVDVNEVATAGPGLSFVVFPQALNAMGGAGRFVGVLFFLSLVFAGITSLISLSEAFSVPMMEKFSVERSKFFTLFSVVGFLISSIYATGAGLYILDIVDYTVNTYGLTLVGILETIALGWMYGTMKSRDHINSVSHIQVGAWWDICIKFLLPIILIISFCGSAITLSREGYEGYPLPAMLAFFGGTVLIVAVVSVIGPRIPWRTPVEQGKEEK